MPASPTTFRSSLAVYRRLLGYVRPFIGAFAVSIFGYLLVASAQPMQAALLKFFVDGLIHPEGAVLPGVALVGGMKVLYAVPLMLVLIAVWQGVGTYLGNYFIAKVSMGVVDTLRRALFDTLLRLPNRYFDQQNSGYLISRITYNVTMVTGAATDAIKVVIREGLDRHFSVRLPALDELETHS
jgi:ATP-binding cassette, subfamily B, bacterial MsbA